MAGNEPDFREIDEKYRPGIKRYMARLVSDDEAEDLTQEVFVRVSRSLDAFRGESSLSTWIYRIATNVAIDRLRSPSFRREKPVIPSVEGQMPEEAGMREGPVPADQQLARKQMGDCVRDVVDTLPPEYKTVIVLAEIEELRNREIADILGVSLDTAKIRLHRARARLKKELEAKCTFGRDERNVFACEPKAEPIKFNKKK